MATAEKIIRLNNGVGVANFSSFSTGSSVDNNVRTILRWPRIFRRHQEQNLIPQHDESIVNKSKRVENEKPDKIRLIQPEDVQAMVDGGWFEDWGRIMGLHGDVLNKNTIPAVWNAETKQKFKDEVLMPFYFPPKNKIHIVANDEKGNFIRDVDVKRQTWVMEWKGKLVASRSFIDADPWITDSDFTKFKIAHAQMLIVAPEEDRKGFALGLAALIQREIFRQGFTQIITWVNMEGIRYGVQEKFFEGMGYVEDMRKKGLIVVTLSSGEKIEMRRYFLTPRAMRANLITDESVLLRWERKKSKIEIAELMQELSRRNPLGRG